MPAVAALGRRTEVGLRGIVGGDGGDGAIRGPVRRGDRSPVAARHGPHRRNAVGGNRRLEGEVAARGVDADKLSPQQEAVAAPETRAVLGRDRPDAVRAVLEPGPGDDDRFAGLRVGDGREAIRAGDAGANRELPRALVEPEQLAVPAVRACRIGAQARACGVVGGDGGDGAFGGPMRRGDRGPVTARQGPYCRDALLGNRGLEGEVAASGVGGDEVGPQEEPVVAPEPGAVLGRDRPDAVRAVLEPGPGDDDRLAGRRTGHRAEPRRRGDPRPDGERSRALVEGHELTMPPVRPLGVGPQARSRAAVGRDGGDGAVGRRVRRGDRGPVASRQRAYRADAGDRGPEGEVAGGGVERDELGPHDEASRAVLQLRAVVRRDGANAVGPILEPGPGNEDRVACLDGRHLGHGGGRCQPRLDRQLARAFIERDELPVPAERLLWGGRFRGRCRGARRAGQESDPPRGRWRRPRGSCLLQSQCHHDSLLLRVAAPQRCRRPTPADHFAGATVALALDRRLRGHPARAGLPETARRTAEAWLLPFRTTLQPTQRPATGAAVPAAGERPAHSRIDRLGSSRLQRRDVLWAFLKNAVPHCRRKPRCRSRTSGG